MRKALLTALAAVILLSSARTLLAQAAPGTLSDANHPAGPPDPEKLDSIWQVDPISDQVSINVPFLTVPQGGRGPTIPFSLLYNSASTVTLQSTGSFYPGIGAQDSTFQWSTYPLTVPLVAPAGPWTTSGPYIYNSAPPEIQDQTQSHNNQNITFVGCLIGGPYEYVDENGSSHELNLIDFSWNDSYTNSNPPANGQPACDGAFSSFYNGTSEPYWSNSSTTDGSALSTNSLSVTGPDGTNVASGGAQGMVLKDANGNQASLSSPNGSGWVTATDTLGRTIYTTNIPIGQPGQTSAGQYTVTTYGATGTAENYTVEFTKETLGTFPNYGSTGMAMPHPNPANNEITSAPFCLGTSCDSNYEVGQPGPGSSPFTNEPTGSFTAVTSISRPDGTSYGFTYDSTYGTISKITFPTGGYVRFCWAVRDQDWTPYGQFGAISSIVVTDVFVSSGGTPGVCGSSIGPDENQWTYTMESLSTSSTPIGYTYAPDGSYTYYTGDCKDFVFTAVSYFKAFPKGTCKETSRAMYDSGGHLKKSVAENYTTQGITRQVATTLYDGPSAVQQLDYYKLDSYSNVIEKDESDFYTCSATPLCPGPTQSTNLPTPSSGWSRITYTTYEPSSAFTSSHIVDKPSQILVTSGGGGVAHLTNFTYDGKGNLTQRNECISISGSGSTATCSTFWQTAYTYDSTGQMLSKTEGANVSSVAAKTTYTWTGPNGTTGTYNGYLTTVTHPNSNLVDHYTYSGYTGEMLTHKDWNGNTTSYDYSDPLNRIKTIALPTTIDGTTGTYASGTTAYNYNDEAGAFSVQEQQTVDAAGTTTSVTKNYDGLGRLTSAVTATPQCSTGIQVVTQYDSMSRVQSVTNPYCSTSDPTYGSTQFAYDALSRKIQTTYPDGSVATISYAGAATELTDPYNGTANVQHVQQVDGLGRLISVCEVTSATYGGNAPAACGQSISGTGFLTTYGHDANDNLLSVSQHGVSRSFSYDGLSRLKQGTNPETGAIQYAYSSPSGACAADPTLPCTRTDARAVATMYTYDNMDRLTSKSYSNSDLTDCYQYDTPFSGVSDSNPKGELTAEWEEPGSTCPAGAQTASPSTSATTRVKASHDALGRVGVDWQCIGVWPCPATTPIVGRFDYSYNLLGNLVQSDNGIYNGSVGAGEVNNLNNSGNGSPSVTWKTTYDEADHVLQTAVQDQPSVWSSTYYSSTPTLYNPTRYDPFGHMTAGYMGASYGTTSFPITLDRAYDNRGRMINEFNFGTGSTNPVGTQSIGTITVTGAEQSNGSSYDGGKITVTFTNNGTQVGPSAWTTFQKGSTPQSVAQGLAGAIGNADSSLVTNTRAGNVDVLTSSQTGSSTDWTVTASVVDTAGFSTPSFAVTGSTMVDGTNSRAGNGVVYSYVVPTGGYAPNGDLLAVSDSVTGDWAFSYDALDRLSTAQAIAGSYSGNYGCWSYDSYGNRLSEAMSGTACNSNPTLVSWADYSTSNNNQMTTTSMTTGQPSPTTSGYVVSYDASGNVLWDGYNRYWYDGEGRICATQVAGGGPAFQYAYDAEGARIAVGTLTSVQPYGNTCDWPFSLSTSGFSLQNQFLVDLSGEQVTELNTSTYNTLNANGLGFEHSNVWIGGQLNVTYDNWGVHFNFEDPLGTKRAVADIAGDVDETCTTLPWGNDVNSGGNVLPLNYIVYDGYPGNSDCTAYNNTPFNSWTTSDGSEHRFTQKEWDPFTGNDYFLARYYSPYFGRFLSPDWSAKVSPVPYASFTDPQSLNLYAYVRNNPLTRVDLDGHACTGMDFRCAMNQAFNQLHQIVDPVINKAGAAGAAVLGKAQKTFQTYTKTNPETGQVYSGRTSGTGTPEENLAARDAGHHMNDQGYGPAVLDKSSANPDAIRGREQQLIDANGGAQSQGGTSGNAINGISDANPNRAQYMSAADQLPGGRAEFSSDAAENEYLQRLMANFQEKMLEAIAGNGGP